MSYFDDEYEEITGFIKRSTDKALLYYDGSHDYWIPHSVIDDLEGVLEAFEDEPSAEITLGVKIWFLEKEGLL